MPLLIQNSVRFIKPTSGARSILLIQCVNFGCNAILPLGKPLYTMLQPDVTPSYHSATLPAPCFNPHPPPVHNRRRMHNCETINLTRDKQLSEVVESASLEVLKVFLGDAAIPLPINLGNHRLAILGSNCRLAQMLHRSLERVAVDRFQPPGAYIACWPMSNPIGRDERRQKRAKKIECYGEARNGGL